MSRNSSVRKWLSEHPRTAGALLTVLVVLTQVNTAVAGSCATTSGP